MNQYNWQQKDWPNFTYSIAEVENELLSFIEKVGKVTGVLSALPENTQVETVIDMMVAEAIKTSEIEGEYLSRKDVMSSIRNNLGLGSGSETVKDWQANGIGQLMIDVRKTYAEKLSKEKLFAWHVMLLRERKDIKTGAWRDHIEPMQIVSGAEGKKKVHFEAPPSTAVRGEMEKFVTWFNETGPGGKKEIRHAPVRAGLAHLYFETVHPFEDGNGRIGRAVAEKALSQGIGRPVLMSLSKTIEAHKKKYYQALENAQRSNEITGWVNYFIQAVLAAQTEAEEQVDFILRKAKFFDRYKHLLTDRQLKVIRRMMEEGHAGFVGGVNASKYASITKTSKATATRDLHDLQEKEVLVIIRAGRSTRYDLNI